MQLDTSQTLRLESQIRNLSIGVFLLFIDGKLWDAGTQKYYHFDNDCRTNCNIPSYGTNPKPNQTALSIIFHLSCTIQKPSELIVERTMGSFLQCIFQGVDNDVTVTRRV